MQRHDCVQSDTLDTFERDGATNCTGKAIGGKQQCTSTFAEDHGDIGSTESGKHIAGGDSDIAALAAEQQVTGEFLIDSFECDPDGPNLHKWSRWDAEDDVVVGVVVRCEVEHLGHGRRECVDLNRNVTASHRDITAGDRNADRDRASKTGVIDHEQAVVTGKGHQWVGAVGAKSKNGVVNHDRELGRAVGIRATLEAERALEGCALDGQAFAGAAGREDRSHIWSCSNCLVTGKRNVDVGYFSGTGVEGDSSGSVE